MNRIVGLLLLVLIPSSLWASDPPLVAVDITGLNDGDYLITKKDGVVSIRSVRLLVPGVTPNPTPGPAPTPPTVLTDRAKAIKDAAQAVTGDSDRSTTATGLATLYRELARQSRTGQIKDVQTLTSLVTATTDMFLAGRGKGIAAMWQKPRDVLSNQWVAVAQSGGSLADYSKLLDEAADGYQATAPMFGISPEMLALILEIIKIVMALLVK